MDEISQIGKEEIAQSFPVATENKHKIQQSEERKSPPRDPWQVVEHKDLSTRKIATKNRIKESDVQNKKTTTIRNLLQSIEPIHVSNKRLNQRKAKTIDLTKQSLNKIIKLTLVDYNAVNFSARTP